MKWLVIILFTFNLTLGQGLPVGNCNESNASINTIFPPNSTTTYTGNSINQENLFLCGPSTIVYDTVYTSGNCRITYVNNGSKYYFSRGSCAYNNFIIAKANSTIVVMPNVTNAWVYHEIGATIINQSSSPGIATSTCNTIIFPNINCNINTGLMLDDATNIGYKLYPNPTNHNLVIDAGNSTCKLIITDLLGTELMNEIFTGKNSFDLKALPNCTYIAKIIIGKSIYYKKIIKTD
jgi:hypothetical protein